MKYLFFEEEVDEKIKGYKTFNLILYILNLIGAGLVSYQYSLVEGYYSPKVDQEILISIFGAMALTSTIFFIIFKLVINIYGESVRNNYYKNRIIEEIINGNNKK